MTESIEAFFSQPIPEELWHYTGVEGALGIIASDTIWATEARHTTDPSEFIHARELGLTLLAELQSEGTDSAAYVASARSEFLKAFYDAGPLSDSDHEVFLVSFSSREDLKSQWTDYGQNATGVSLCFDLRAIRPNQSFQSAVTLAPCVYEVAEQRALLNGAMQQVYETVKSINQQTTNLAYIEHLLRGWSIFLQIYHRQFDRTDFLDRNVDFFRPRIRAAAYLSAFDMLRVASHVKNRFYFQEEEWRLALPHKKGMPLISSEIKYRGPNANIPYVATKLFSERLPITRIMLGPLCKDRAKIEDALKAKGLSISISQSNAPIRLPEQI